MLQSRIASKGSMSYYIFRERLTEGKKAAQNRVHGCINWATEVWDLYLQGEAAFSSSSQTRTTAHDWHKHVLAQEPLDNPNSQHSTKSNKKDLPEPVLPDLLWTQLWRPWYGLHSLSISAARRTRIYRQKILTETILQAPIHREFVPKVFLHLRLSGGLLTKPAASHKPLPKVKWSSPKRPGCNSKALWCSTSLTPFLI